MKKDDVKAQDLIQDVVKNTLELCKEYKKEDIKKLLINFEINYANENIQLAEKYKDDCEKGLVSDEKNKERMNEVLERNRISSNLTRLIFLSLYVIDNSEKVTNTMKGLN
jgi:DNA polymerase sigma